MSVEVFRSHRAPQERTLQDRSIVLNNVLPQHEKLNSPVWSGLEGFSREVVVDRDRELYILAGGYGTKLGKGVVKAFDKVELLITFYQMFPKKFKMLSKFNHSHGQETIPLTHLQL